VLDIVLVLLILLLSMKGFFNGFVRESVGFAGLIGGIFVASRAAQPVAAALSTWLNMDNSALMKLAGFLLILALIWGGSAFVATIFTALRAQPHTLLSRSLGMVVAGAKYILIFSMIIASLFNNALLRDNFAKTIRSSYLFPKFNAIGSVLANIAPLSNTKISIKKSSKS
jgi:membrane protein required for colicin V production